MTMLRQALIHCSAAIALAAFAASAPAFAAGKSKDAADSGSGFLGQMQVTATIMRQLRPVGLLQVDAGLVIPDATMRGRAQALGPVLRATWRSVAQDYVTQMYTPGRVPDAAVLAARMQTATDRVFGARGAQVVLVSVIAR